jgi:hypothetical protein
MIYLVFPLRFYALLYIVKKHMRPLMMYIFRTKNMLLLIFMEPNSGPCASWPPVILSLISMQTMAFSIEYPPMTYMHTINFCKNYRSLVKYFLTYASTYSIYWLALPFFNNFHPPTPFLAHSNKYRYPTPIYSRLATCSMKL